MFITNVTSADLVNPIANLQVSGKGTKGAWFGWPDDPKIEALRDAYARADSADEQKRIAAEIQAEAYSEVICIPLGQSPPGGSRSRCARRPGHTGVLEHR
jgi:peptide/nickel transport system substrate-binding protein